MKTKSMAVIAYGGLDAMDPSMISADLPSGYASIEMPSPEHAARRQRETVRVLTCEIQASTHQTRQLRRCRTSTWPAHS